MARRVEVGDVYGKLTVQSQAPSIKSRKRFNCLCICGAEKVIREDGLQSGHSHSCGCTIRSPYVSGTDYTGKVCGEWLICRKDPDVNGYYICLCSCGTLKSIEVGTLVHGQSKSCGCLGGIAKVLGQRFGKLLVIGAAPQSHGVDREVYCTCDCGGTAKVKVYNLICKNGTKSCGCLCRVENDAHKAYQRVTPEYKHWRSAVYQRDNFTCSACNAFSGKLTAHHINSYSKYPDLRLEDLNGVTLCVGCHKEFHKQYGLMQFTCWDYAKFRYVKQHSTISQ